MRKIYRVSTDFVLEKQGQEFVTTDQVLRGSYEGWTWAGNRSFETNAERFQENRPTIMINVEICVKMGETKKVNVSFIWQAWVFLFNYMKL